MNVSGIMDIMPDRFPYSSWSPAVFPTDYLLSHATHGTAELAEFLHRHAHSLLMYVLQHAKTPIALENIEVDLMTANDEDGYACLVQFYVPMSPAMAVTYVDQWLDTWIQAEEDAYSKRVFDSAFSVALVGYSLR